MKSFKKYCKLREEEESINPSDSGEHSALFRIVRLAWSNHRAETRGLFKRLAAIDPQIASEMERIGNISDLPSKEKEEEKDEVRPSSADTGDNVQDDGGD